MTPVYEWEGELDGSILKPQVPIQPIPLFPRVATRQHMAKGKLPELRSYSSS